jgi:hypothetical protein
MLELPQCPCLVISSSQFIGFCSGVALHLFALIWSAALLFQEMIDAALSGGDKAPKG